MPKTTAYRIVTAMAADQVTEEVNGLLEGGWELLGDLKVDAGIYSQAMVQREYYEQIDYHLSVQIDDLDSIRYAMDKIGEALDTAATTLIHIAKTLPPPE